LDEGVKADLKGIDAILRYSVPKNQRKFRKFLGICNFRQQFVLNCGSYVEPILILLCKGNKWKWTDVLQQALETLRAKFANSYQLIYPK